MKKAGKRDRVQDPVTIEVSKETRDNLKKMKEDEDLRNMDAVVRELLGKSLRALKAVVAIHGVESEDIEEDEDDGKTPLPQKMFSSELIRNVKALRYYTGLTILTYKWVLSAMRSAVRTFFFFAHLWCGPTGASLVLCTSPSDVFLTHTLHLACQRL